jgi:hypothetical protein
MGGKRWPCLQPVAGNRLPSDHAFPPLTTQTASLSQYHPCKEQRATFHHAMREIAAA